MQVDSDMDCRNLDSLLNEAAKILIEEPNFINLPLDRPIVFAGDTHGDFTSSRKVIERFGKTSTIVFLGDYVDRATEHLGSLKNIVFLLENKIKHPRDIFLLRGNHEFEEVYQLYGFQEELGQLNGDGWWQIGKDFKMIFRHMPYVVETDNGLLGLHAGLPDIKSRANLEKIPKGIEACFSNRIVGHIVWNDNILDKEQRYMPKSGIGNSSRRGSEGNFFSYGEPFFSDKMGIIGKEVLVRGHYQYAKGYALHDRILTIFTSERYRDAGQLEGVYVALMKDPQKQLQSAKDLEIVQI